MGTVGVPMSTSTPADQGVIDASRLPRDSVGPTDVSIVAPLVEIDGAALAQIVHGKPTTDDVVDQLVGDICVQHQVVVHDGARQQHCLELAIHPRTHVSPCACCLQKGCYRLDELLDEPPLGRCKCLIVMGMRGQRSEDCPGFVHHQTGTQVL